MTGRCGPGSHLVKSYARSSGTRVKSHCAKNPHRHHKKVGRPKKSGSSRCGPGKQYVKSYTKKSGTRVKGHCTPSTHKVTKEDVLAWSRNLVKARKARWAGHSRR